MLSAINVSGVSEYDTVLLLLLLPPTLLLLSLLHALYTTGAKNQRATSAMQPHSNLRAEREVV
jgi:hypothetical protein